MALWAATSTVSLPVAGWRSNSVLIKPRACSISSGSGL